MKSIKVILKNNLDESISKYDAIINNNKIIYNEEEYKVVLEYNDTLKITRENSEYLFKLEFISNKKTSGKCILKQSNLTMDLDILTDYIIIENNLIIVKYNVITTNQNVLFRLEIE
jgi:hypothetical protein